MYIKSEHSDNDIACSVLKKDGKQASNMWTLLYIYAYIYTDIWWNVIRYLAVYGAKIFAWFSWFTVGWASYQIHKIARSACAGNAGDVFPATDFKEKR